MVCDDVEIEPVLQEITGESLNKGDNRALMLGLTNMLADFGRDKGLHSLTSGCSTQMQILTEISVPSKSSETMKMKSGSMATR